MFQNAIINKGLTGSIKLRNNAFGQTALGTRNRQEDILVIITNGNTGSSQGRDEKWSDVIEP